MHFQIYFDKNYSSSQKTGEGSNDCFINPMIADYAEWMLFCIQSYIDLIPNVDQWQFGHTHSLEEGPNCKGY